MANGLTLTELLVDMAILAILATLILPAVDRIRATLKKQKANHEYQKNHLLIDPRIDGINGLFQRDCFI